MLKTLAMCKVVYLTYKTKVFILCIYLQKIRKKEYCLYIRGVLINLGVHGQVHDLKDKQN